MENSGRTSERRYLVRGGSASCSEPLDTASIGSLVPDEHYVPGKRHETAHWPKGLRNVGNTCYANAALQCLLSTALAHALLDQKAAAIFRRYSSNPNILARGSGSVDSSDEENDRPLDKERRRKEREDRRLSENSRWLTRTLRTITVDYHAQSTVDASDPLTTTISQWLYIAASPTPVVDPGAITRQPNKLSPCLRPFQQEDAHEFLRALLGTLTMSGQNKSLSSLFDGLLESAVTCQTCRRPSLTRDRYMDLSLDIQAEQIETLTDALHEFTKTELLNGENKVNCGRCGTKRIATKGLRLATAPSILVCHFKRFAFDRFGNVARLSRKVQFPLRLEIGAYMSRVNKARPPPYDLVAVLVHQGQSCERGHYVAFVKKHGEWFECNDERVTKVDVALVLSQQAYILMYEVAEMRENHGFPSPHRLAKRVNKEDIRAASSSRQASCDFSLASLLCGMDQGILGDAICCDMSTYLKKTKRRKARSSQDDLSTLGESTVDSSAPPFRRSASSGNILRPRQGQSGTHSTPRACQRFAAVDHRNTVGMERRAEASSDMGTVVEIPRFSRVASKSERLMRAEPGSLPPRYGRLRED